MKSLWILFALSAGLAIAASCGPQQAYCPNTGKNGVCPITGDEAGVSNGTGGNGGTNGCPAGQQLEPNPDGGGLICVPV